MKSLTEFLTEALVSKKVLKQFEGLTFGKFITWYMNNEANSLDDITEDELSEFYDTFIESFDEGKLHSKDPQEIVDNKYPNFEAFKKYVEKHQDDEFKIVKVEETDQTYEVYTQFDGIPFVFETIDNPVETLLKNVNEALINKKVTNESDWDKLTPKNPIMVHNCYVEIDKQQSNKFNEVSKEQLKDMYSKIDDLLADINKDKVYIKRINLDGYGPDGEAWDIYSDYCNDGESDWCGTFTYYKNDGYIEFEDQSDKTKTSDFKEIVDWFPKNEYK